MDKDVLEVFVLSLPSKLGHEKVAMSTAASVAKLMGFSEDRIEDLKTAVAEACINSIEHGNRMDESLKVGIILSVTATTLEIRVGDQGSGLGAKTPPPDIDSKMGGEENPRGMGKFLIQALMDEVEWINSLPTGSCARLLIHLEKPAGGGVNAEQDNQRQSERGSRTFRKTDNGFALFRRYYQHVERDGAWHLSGSATRGEAYPVGSLEGGVHEFEWDRADHSGADAGPQHRRVGPNFRSIRSF